ncbi:MAG: hypothetical protein JJU11_18700, partial [Candidatus Sumerlaeia bacterium]|nr:hypothetical protein [Candidatus Sumerlaeia bacterium]
LSGSLFVQAREPIWVAPDRPEPLAPLQLRTGQQGDISVYNAASGPVESIKAVRSTPDGITLSHEGEIVTVKAPEDTEGLYLLSIDVSLRGGSTETLQVPVILQQTPIVEFTYSPPEGTTPGRVALAGEFNGWSSGSDLLEQDEEGVFRIEYPLEPGTWSYKFVVDGNWIPDPGNPERDSGGHDNSVIRVEGAGISPFEFVFLAADMPGAGEHGGVRALLPPDGSIDPDNVSIILNNRVAPKEGWSLDSGTNTISFQFSGDYWFSENYVTIAARSADGRPGLETFLISSSDAPRSPRDEIIYFPMTDRFYDGDPSLSNPMDDERLIPLVNYMGGDFAGIRKKIEDGYFTDLGVTALWLSPVNQNTQNVMKETIDRGYYFTSYHGYWPTSFTETNEQFGSMDDLKALVAAAHEKGIAILLDFVSNHVHDEHPLYQENPDWKTEYILPDGSKNLRRFDDHPLTTWFDSFMPTLDYEGNDEITDIMVENAIWWLEETGADGFRHDAVKHVPTKFWRTLTRTLDEKYRWERNQLVYQVGETIGGHSIVTEYLGPDLLPAQFDFPLYFTIQNVLGRGTGRMIDLGGTINDSRRFYPPASIMSPLIGNHDVPRFMAYVEGTMNQNPTPTAWSNPPGMAAAESHKPLRLAFAFLMAMPGAPMVYYGDEIGLTGVDDPDNRRMMHWTDWTDAEQKSLETTSAIIHARHGSVALRRGNLHVIDGGAEHLFLASISPEEVVLSAFFRKPSEETITLSLPAWWGSVHGLDPLLEGNGITANLNENRVVFQPQNYSYGYWKIQR